jgi:acetylornithine deacetylase/succinyl-diaminopimelate desuccinylase-like protein
MPVAEDAIQLTRALVALDTVNPALVPGAPGERPAVELLAGRLAPRGFELEVIGPPARPSLLARHRGPGGGRTLALCGHLDTVGTDGMADPFSARIEGDRLFGRGSCDMKAGVAAMVVAAEHAATAGTDGDVVLALVADEEHASLGSAAVLAHLAASGPLPDACLIGEPTWLDLIVAHRGFAVVEVELRGQAAHSSLPRDGVNAVTHLGRLLAAVEALDADLAARPPHPYAGTGSIQATVASGGSAPFVLPAHASAVIERRTLPGEAPDTALREVESILAQLAADDPAVRASCRGVMARDAWEIASEAPPLQRLVALLEAALGPARTGAPYWMESALWERAGVPTVVCGPAGGGLHTDAEWVELGQLRTYATALSDVVTAFCGA